MWGNYYESVKVSRILGVTARAEWVGNVGNVGMCQKGRKGQYYHNNHPSMDFATYALVTQALPSYRNKVVRILNDPCKGQATILHGEQIPIKKAWMILHNQELRGTDDMDVLHWMCSCGAQKYHSYLLCKHLVQAVCCPNTNWWATLVQYHIPPFYNVYELLSPEDWARAPDPEELGNRLWLARMPDMQSDPNSLAMSLLPVCLVYL
jgi:hypothetical protein